MGPDDPTTVELLLTLGLADEEAVRRAVEVQRAAAELGLPESLFEIIWKKRLLGERNAATFADHVALETPPSIPGYRITSRRGFAGIAVVFEAVEVATGRPVVLKVLSPLVGNEPVLAERFEREIGIVSGLRHPCLPRLLDAGASGGHRYFAIEGGGRFLTDLVAGRPLPTARCLDLAEDICRALSHLPCLHLGIRPASVLARPEGRWLLLDPGATPEPSERVATFPGVAFAEPLYGAPEVRRGAPPGPQADVFSLGATLLTAATGRLPVGAPGALAGDAPQPLRAIIARALDEDPARRFSGPEEFLGALEGARAATAPRSVARPAPPPIPVQAPTQERRTGLFWSALLVFLVCALAVVGARALLLGLRRPPRAVQPRPSSDVKVPAPRPEPRRATRTSDRASQRAANLARDALRYDRSHPAAHGEAVLRLRRALLASGPGNATVLEERRSARQAALEGAAAKAFAELTAKVTALRGQNRFGEALRACGQFPPELRFGAWAERLAATIRAIGAAAELRYQGLASGAIVALKAGRYDDALAAYESIGRLGIPWMSDVSAAFLAAARPYAEVEKKRLAAFQTERARYVRRASFGRLQPYFSKVAQFVEKHDPAGALTALKEIPEELRAGELGRAVERLATRVNAWADVWKRVLQGPRSAIGQSLEVHGVKGIIEGFDVKSGVPRVRLSVREGAGRLAQPIKRLPPEAIRRLAELATMEMQPREAALALGLFSVCEGRAGEARSDFREAASLGADIEPFLEELEAEKRVSEALDAYDKKQWARARGLLESLLDDCATTPAVVLKHKRLTAALKVTLAKLGERPGPPVLVRSPIPASLRRLPILPETRLQARAPADPLQAYLGKPLVRGGPVVAGFSTWRDYSVVVRWGGESDADFVVAGRLSGPRDGEFLCYYLALRGGRLSLWRLDEAGHRILRTAPAPELRTKGHHQLEFKLIGENLAAFADARPLIVCRDAKLTKGRLAVICERGTLLLDGLDVYFHGATK